jgi:multicomponent Na+:H+ antiporter subunit C
MNHCTLYALCGVVLFGIGFYGTVFCRHLLRKVMALNLMGAGVFLVFIALAARTPNAAPDPVPHAMVLTGIVVAVSSTALMLALIRRLHRETGLTELPEHTDTVESC